MKDQRKSVICLYQISKGGILVYCAAMSNLSTKILVISLLFRISTSLECHKCNKGYLAFVPPDRVEASKKDLERLEEDTRLIESGQVSDEFVFLGCQAA